jgi:two-component system chemotaxis sensor kinase CheA
MEVELIIKGEETELDKKVLESIKGPLIHILRNAVDHGMESHESWVMRHEKECPKKTHDSCLMSHDNTITLSAFQEGGKVIIEVVDNGQGIDLEFVKETAVKKAIASRDELEAMTDKEVLNLIFAEGFSTAPIITDVSGRGIGLSVVRAEMERLKGKTVINSKKGAGTTIRLELPLTIAVLQVLLVEAGGVKWALPISNLKESLKVKASAIATIENRMIMQVREHSVPVVSLADILGIQRQERYASSVMSDAKNHELVTHDAQLMSHDEQTIVIVSSMNKQVGFMVDRVFGEEEVFIKNIGPHLGKVMCVAGATILANGEVIVILDVADLVTQAELAHPSLKPRKKRDVQKRKRVLLVEDSMVTRELEKTILENGGYAVETAIDGLDAVEKLVKAQFDIIVSDILMPRMDGFELCKNVKTNEKLQKIPVIFVTALAKDSEKRKGIEVGAQAYITKSEFDQTHLLETIERLI